MNEMNYVFESLDFDYEKPLDCIADVAVDSKGNIFAMVGGDEPIVVFNSKGNYQFGWGKGLIAGCHGIFIDAGDFVYIADSGDHVVMKFTPEGKLLMTLGNRGTHSDTGSVNANFKTIKQGAGPFYAPSKVTVSPKGEIFVADGYGNSRIHRFSAGGILLKSWGEPDWPTSEYPLPGHLHPALQKFCVVQGKSTATSS